MKKILSTIALLSVFVTCAASGTSEESPFELKDIYLQADHQRPYLVTDKPTPTRVLRLGDSFRVWVTVQLRPDAKSPCTPRDEDPCYLEYRIVDKVADRNRLEYADDDVRINGKTEFSMSYPIVRTSTLGEKVFLFRIRHRDKILNSFEVPLEIME